MRELLALAAVACLDFWPGEVVERRIYLTWLASRGSVVHAPHDSRHGAGSGWQRRSLVAPGESRGSRHRATTAIRSLFATLLPKDAQVEVEMPDGRRFLMPRRRLKVGPRCSLD